MEGPYVGMYSILFEIRNIMRQLQVWKINDMLEMIRNALTEHRNERGFDLSIDLLTVYAQPHCQLHG